MFTLQVLDRGQTFSYPVPDRAIVVGSKADADLHLDAHGVEGQHARLEPCEGGVRLVALSTAKVNGVEIESAELQFGDRVEVGAAILMVGRAVAQAAALEEEFESISEELSSASSDVPAARPERRSPRGPARRSKLPVFFALLVVVGLIVLGVSTNTDDHLVQGQLDEISRLCEKGRIDSARAKIEHCRKLWAKAEDDRLQRLDRASIEVENVAVAIEEIDRRVLDPESGNYADWNTELRRMRVEALGPDSVAARVVLARLRDTLERREPDRSTPPVVVEQQPVEPVTQPEDAPAGCDVDATLADAHRLEEQGLFAQALSLLGGELGQAAEAADVERLQSRSAELRGAALAGAKKLVADARGLADKGQLREAVTMLALARHRFPQDGEFVEIGQTLRAFERTLADAERSVRPASAGSMPAVPPQPISTSGDTAKASPGAAAPDSGTRMATFAMLRVTLDRIRDAEAIGDFATATALLREAAGAARASDAEFADRLEARAAGTALGEALHAKVAEALASGRTLTTTLVEGGEAVLATVQGPRFRTADDRGPFGWPDFTAAGTAGLVEQVGVAGVAALGGASLIYDRGETALAEQLLAKALRADGGLKEQVDRVIAKGRGERFDERGYVLEKGAFVSVKEIELRKAIARAQKRVASLVRGRDEKARTQYVAEMMAGGPDNVEILGKAVDGELRKLAGRLDTGSLRKQVSRLAEHRAELDDAREHALTLIYDEKKYFYPFRPPAVSGTKAAEYWTVQQEVDKRVAALRALWGDTRTKVKVPSSLRSDLARVDWCVSVLRRVGAFDPNAVADIAWARALPLDATITIREFCLTTEERYELEEWNRIGEHNRAVGRELTSAVRELLRITNDYRTMFRHRPLAVSAQVCEAAQGHADEMSNLGYFSHFSPTPGRRTPFDRMKLAGYQYGVSENIATNGSAMGAHNAWLHSSGHHRNLLRPTHREMGIGLGGRNWVENFGTGSTYRESEAYKAALGEEAAEKGSGAGQKVR